MAQPTASHPTSVPDARPLPGPRGYPLIGVLPDVLRGNSALPVLKDAWRVHGDALQLKIGPYAICFFAHPDAIKHILVDNRDNYGRAQRQIRWISPAVGESLFASEGAHWRRQRHFMQGPFAVKAIAAYAPSMAAAAQEVIDSWERRLDDGQPVIEVSAEMVYLTMDALGRSILGFSTRSAIATLNEAFLSMVAAMLKQAPEPLNLPLWLPTPNNLRFKRALRQLNEIISETIRVRRADPDTYSYASDALSIMLRAQDEWGEGMLERHLRDEVMTLYFAGHEATGVGLTWAFNAIAQHPEVEARLHEEIDRVLGDGEPTPEVVDRLTYTDMVVRETLRLYPAVTMLLRDAREDDQIGGYRVPRGSTVVISPYLTQRHPEFWPAPERFDPERHAPAQANGRHRYSWIALGGGYHNCLGGAFATQEMKIAIAMIARRYRLRLIPEQPTHPVEMISLRPFGGLHMRLERRR